MVHRPFRLAEIIYTLKQHKLEPKRMRLVHPYEDKEPNMVLIDAAKGGKQRITVEPTLIVYNKEDVVEIDCHGGVTVVYKVLNLVLKMCIRDRSRTTGSFPVFTVYLGFELSFCSMDFPADITLRKTRMKFELTFKVVLLFSYQGFVCSFFCDTTSLFYLIQKFLSRTFLFCCFFLSKTACTFYHSLSRMSSTFL